MKLDSRFCPPELWLNSMWSLSNQTSKGPLLRAWFRLLLCVAQVKVQESGGPEEIFNVVCKWAATVDIRSLNEYIK